MTIKKFLQILGYSITNGEGITLNINDKDITIEFHEGYDDDYVLPCIVYKDAYNGQVMAIIHEAGCGAEDYWDAWTDNEIEIYDMEV